MAERYRPKEITQDPDVQIVGSFGGLSSASYQNTGEVIFADKLVNGYVSARNEIAVRKGSRSAFWIGAMTAARAASLSTHTFVFDGVNYMASKVGTAFWLVCFDKDWQYITAISKNNVFYTVSDTEEATITTVIEGNTCYLLVATKSTPLVVLPLIKRDVAVNTTSTGTSFTGTISRYPHTDVLSTSNMLLFNSSGANIKLTSASQSTFTLSFTTSAAHGLGVGSKVKVHFWFYTYGTSANYYPGSYMFNSSVRRNSIPLDANVAIPTPIYSNPLLNETQVQDIDTTSFSTTAVQKTPVTAVYTRVSNNNPSNNTQWDYGDGAYVYVDANTLTTRSPYFVSFGGLTAGGNSEPVYFYRWREILVCPNTNLQDSDFSMFYDKVSVAGRYATRTGGSSVSGNAFYFTVPTSNRPSLSAVVEIMYNYARPSSVVVDFTDSNASIVIADGCIFPIYGYSAFADIRIDTYPNQVITVGNRVVMSGYSNRVTVSHADWNFRGVSWNNFQVSDIDFTTNSAYTVSIGQQSSAILGTTSVNGVLIVATDSGIYRISGQAANSPPNASTALVSRVSNEVVDNSKCLIIYENRVFFASQRGLYQLQYSNTTEEINTTPLSTQVSDLFENIPICLNYSSVHRAFIIYFKNSSEALMYTFASETFSTIKFAFAPVSFAYSQSMDGFVCSFTDSANVAPHWIFWDNLSTTDLSNALLAISPYTSSLGIRNTVTVNATSVSVSSMPTSLDNITPPVDFVSLLSPTLATAYGANHATSSTPPEIISYPTTGGIKVYPIECFYVSKAFSSNKLIRANRVRAVNLLLAGNGMASTAIVLANRTPQFDTTSVNLTGQVQETLSEVSRVVSGDLVNIRLRVLGVSEYWSIAIRLTDTLKLLGYQVDTSTKKLGRLT